MTQATLPTIRVPLQDIVDVDGLPYRDIDEDHVTALVAANEPDTWPPIVVTMIGMQFGLIAGQHRREAARRLELTSLPAYVRTYNQATLLRSAYLDMWEDNARNGLTYTIAERKEYAVTLSVIYPDMSYNEIGRRAGIDDKTAKSAVMQSKQKEQKDNEPDTEQREYNTSMVDPAKRFIAALNKFIDTEINTFGAKYSDRNVERRARALARYIKGSTENISLLHSLAQTFEHAARYTEEKIAKKTPAHK